VLTVDARERRVFKLSISASVCQYAATARYILVILVLMSPGGCATLGPGADFPKTASAALAHPEDKRKTKNNN